MFKRIIVVGTTGAGKSTLAGQLAQKLILTHIELDALFWGENWAPAELAIFRQHINETIQEASAGWVLDGKPAKNSGGQS